MLVRDLVAKLQEYPQDIPVFINDPEYGLFALVNEHITWKKADSFESRNSDIESGLVEGAEFVRIY